MGVIIIAEVGVNHNGDSKIAKKMVELAKEAGADYIKFQTFTPNKLATITASKASYQKELTDKSESQIEMLNKLSLKAEEFIMLKEYCDEKEIGFMSTPFDNDSIEVLKPLNMDYWKIPSGEITNLPYLEAIGKLRKKVILSTGMAEMSEIVAAIDILRKNGTEEIIILQCNTEYPTPMCDVNLKAMSTIKHITGCRVGYSDHTKGIEVPIAAVALGAEVIEKHFTLDRNMEGPDHKASLEPDELKEMISCIRNIEMALGTGEKTKSQSERKNIEIARKSIVAACDINKGEVFSDKNLITKRPGKGISPMKWYELIGKNASKDYIEDELIDESEL